MIYELKQVQGMPANFRDLGGIRTMDGKRIAGCRILRSGDLSQLTEDAKEILQKKYQLRGILDLRTKKERESAPDCKVAGAAYYVLDFFPVEKSSGDSCIENGSLEQMNHIRDIDQVHQYMVQLYRSFITSNLAKKSLKELVEFFLKIDEGAVLFHCFAGKDRTGISAAVLLSLLGVSKEDIFLDYMKTNELRYEINKKILSQICGQKKAAERSDEESFCKAMEAALSVDDSYLEASYDEAKKLYGSFENYILEGIGVSKADRERLRELYLEK